MIMISLRGYILIREKKFESSLIKQLCKLPGIEKTRTTLYQTEGNGQCECFNRTMLNLLRTLPQKRKYAG